MYMWPIPAMYYQSISISHMHIGLIQIIKMQLRFIKKYSFYFLMKNITKLDIPTVAQNIKVLTTKRHIWCARSMIYEKMLQKCIWLLPADRTSFRRFLKRKQNIKTNWIWNFCARKSEKKDNLAKSQCLLQRLKSKFFEIFFRMERPQRGLWSDQQKFQNTIFPFLEVLCLLIMEIRKVKFLGTKFQILLFFEIIHLFQY